MLSDWYEGDPSAGEVLAEAIYGELRRVAQLYMMREQRAQTLQPTVLVNEVVLSLMQDQPDCHDRAHLFALSARMMRHFLVNHARANSRYKRGGDAVQVTLHNELDASVDPLRLDLVDLSEALEALGEFDTRKRDVLEQHYFAGLSYPDIASIHDISRATVHRELRTARAWITSRLHAQGQATPSAPDDA